MNKEILSEDIVLQNDRVILLPFENKRNKELQDIIFNDDIWEYMGIYIWDEADFNAYVEETIRQKKEGLSYPFLIIDKHTNRVAGSTRFGNINISSEKCEIGWTWYGREFQGTGLNQACKFQLLKFGFENIGFRRIQFSADQENIRSQKAIEKLGARREGVFKNNYVDPEGRSKDDVYFSIIREEWLDIKTRYFYELVNTELTNGLLEENPAALNRKATNEASKYL